MIETLEEDLEQANKELREYAGNLEINVKDFSDTLSRVSVLSSEKYKGIRLITSTDGVRISANNPEQEEAEEFLPTIRWKDLWIITKYWEYQAIDYTPSNIFDTGILRIFISN